jgi:hypothetical protein
MRERTISDPLPAALALKSEPVRCSAITISHIYGKLPFFAPADRFPAPDSLHASEKSKRAGPRLSPVSTRINATKAVHDSNPLIPTLTELIGISQAIH